MARKTLKGILTEKLQDLNEILMLNERLERQKEEEKSAKIKNLNGTLELKNLEAERIKAEIKTTKAEKVEYRSNGKFQRSRLRIATEQNNHFYYETKNYKKQIKEYKVHVAKQRLIFKDAATETIQTWTKRKNLRNRLIESNKREKMLKIALGLACCDENEVEEISMEAQRDEEVMKKFPIDPALYVRDLKLVRRQSQSKIFGITFTDSDDEPLKPFVYHCEDADFTGEYYDCYTEDEELEEAKENGLVIENNEESDGEDYFHQICYKRVEEEQESDEDEYESSENNKFRVSEAEIRAAYDLYSPHLYAIRNNHHKMNELFGRSDICDPKGHARFADRFSSIEEMRIYFQFYAPAMKYEKPKQDTKLPCYGRQLKYTWKYLRPASYRHILPTIEEESDEELEEFLDIEAKCMNDEIQKQIDEDHDAGHEIQTTKLEESQIQFGDIPPEVFNDPLKLDAAYGISFIQPDYVKLDSSAEKFESGEEMSEVEEGKKFEGDHKRTENFEKIRSDQKNELNEIPKQKSEEDKKSENLKKIERYKQIIAKNKQLETENNKTENDQQQPEAAPEKKKTKNRSKKKQQQKPKKTRKTFTKLFGFGV